MSLHLTHNRHINQNLEALARQLYDYWFVQFDFPDANGKPYKSNGGKMVWNEKLKREIPEGWEVKCIGDILGNVKNTPRVMTDSYHHIGLFPIIDQSRDNYIAGFTDKKEALLNQYPVVVFGDHSCVAKYVNFAFCRGADGTQIMFSKDERLPAEYLYFAVKDVKISEGYARHYVFLKESLIVLPKIDIATTYKNQTNLLFESIREYGRQIMFLQRTREELLPLLMNGQVSL